jgi:hypothetical protein
VSVNESIPRSEKHELARDSLPRELRQHFDAFVDDYKFSAIAHYHKPFISYAVLADMVRCGWRRTESPTRRQSK